MHAFTAFEANSLNELPSCCVGYLQALYGASKIAGRIQEVQHSTRG